jgi:outer membrane protein TolC
MKTCFLAAVACAIATHTVRAQPLTLDDAVRYALTNQPLLASQEATIEASRQNAVAEAQLPDPRLKLGLNNLPVTGPDQFSTTKDFMTMRSIGIEQVLPAGDKRRLRGERAELEAELAAAELENLKRTVRRDAQLAWLATYLALRNAAVANDALKFYERQTEAAEIALRSGRSNLAEVARLRVEIELQRDRLRDLAGQERKARAELARWVGAAAQRELASVLPARAPPPAIGTLREHTHDHPQLSSARAEIALAQNDLRQANAAYRPDWSVEFTYSKRGPAYSDMISLQVGVDLPLFTANRQDRRVAAKVAAKEKHDQQHENHRRMLVAELESAHAAWLAFMEREQNFAREVIPTSAKRVDAALIGYRAASIELPAVIEAYRMHVDVLQQHLALQVELARARVQLDYLAGEKESP